MDIPFLCGRHVDGAVVGTSQQGLTHHLPRDENLVPRTNVNRLHHDTPSPPWAFSTRQAYHSCMDGAPLKEGWPAGSGNKMYGERYSYLDTFRQNISVDVSLIPYHRHYNPDAVTFKTPVDCLRSTNLVARYL